MLVKLPVPFFSQLNNSPELFGSPFRQCNLTSTSMALDYLLKGQLSERSQNNGYPEPESYYGSKLIKYGDTTNHDAHTQCLSQDFKISSQWRYDLTRKDIITQLDRKLPVPAGVLYKASGHIICFVGYSEKGLIAHDPYGTRNGSSDDYCVGVGGEYDFYSWDLLDQIFWDGGKEVGWGRIFAGEPDVAS